MDILSKDTKICSELALQVLSDVKKGIANSDNRFLFDALKLYGILSMSTISTWDDGRGNRGASITLTFGDSGELTLELNDCIDRDASTPVKQERMFEICVQVWLGKAYVMLGETSPNDNTGYSSYTFDMVVEMLQVMYGFFHSNKKD